jgi:hypothetical protein
VKKIRPVNGLKPVKIAGVQESLFQLGGYSMVKRKGRPVLGSGIFPKHQAGHAFSPSTFSVGDFSS